MYLVIEYAEGTAREQKGTPPEGIRNVDFKGKTEK